ncbi:MAG: glycosyltransferase family 4 protein [Methyloceanibacter sp.]|nr:glycosyltransferase family 4 protein [Methyloceanibacter sp.]
MPEVTILQVVPRLDAGGSEQAAVEIAQALTRAGASALVATEGGRMATALTEAGGEIVLLPMASKNPLAMLANARRLARLIEERGVDLVHARSRAPAWSALLAARRTGRPFVTTYHGAYGSPGPLKSAYNSVMARGDRVIANSHYTAGLIASRHHVATERIRTIYRGVDLARFSPETVSEDRLARLRAAWEVRKEQPVVLQAARLTSWKGQSVVIEAARQLRNEDRLGNAVIVMAGDAQGREAYRKELDRLIATSGLAGRVKLVGHCDDMPAAFALAHVAVIASTSAEAFGRTSIEAQAMGCPVIASDIGAVPETILAASRGEHAYTGWVVPCDDPHPIAARLAEALALSPQDRAAIAARGRRHVASKFTLAEMQRATLAVYDELLGTRLAAAFDEHVAKGPPRGA